MDVFTQAMKSADISLSLVLSFLLVLLKVMEHWGGAARGYLHSKHKKKVFRIDVIEKNKQNHICFSLQFLTTLKSHASYYLG